MRVSDAAKLAIENGVPPIILSCYTVKPFNNPKKPILRSVLSINSMVLGCLTPTEYRFVARRTKQGDALVERHLEKLVSSYETIVKKHKDFECITIPAFPRLLKENRLSGMLSATLADNGHIPAHRLCAELSADILFDNYEDVKKELSNIRRLGVRIAISEVGDDFCPLTRLTALKPDFVFADSVDAYKIHEESEDTANLVKYFHVTGTAVYSPLIANRALLSAVKSLGFDGYLDNTPTGIGGVNQ